MPIVGWVGTSAYGAPITVFWLFQLPPLVDKNEALANSLLGWHAVAGLSMGGAGADPHRRRALPPLRPPRRRARPHAAVRRLSRERRGVVAGLRGRGQRRGGGGEQVGVADGAAGRGSAREAPALGHVGIEPRLARGVRPTVRQGGDQCSMLGSEPPGARCGLDGVAARRQGAGENFGRPRPERGGQNPYRSPGGGGRPPQRRCRRDAGATRSPCRRHRARRRPPTPAVATASANVSTKPSDTRSNSAEAVTRSAPAISAPMFTVERSALRQHTSTGTPATCSAERWLSRVQVVAIKRCFRHREGARSRPHRPVRPPLSAGPARADRDHDSSP
jgi:hypothetical protein